MINDVQVTFGFFPLLLFEKKASATISESVSCPFHRFFSTSSPTRSKGNFKRKGRRRRLFFAGFLFFSSLTISFITRTICIKKQETVIRCYCEAKMVWERDISVHKNGFMRVCSKNGISFFYSASSSSQAKRRTTGSEINLSEKLKKNLHSKIQDA